MTNVLDSFWLSGVRWGPNANVSWTSVLNRIIHLWLYVPNFLSDLTPKPMDFLFLPCWWVTGKIPRTLSIHSNSPTSITASTILLNSLWPRGQCKPEVSPASTVEYWGWPFLMYYLGVRRTYQNKWQRPTTEMASGSHSTLGHHFSHLSTDQACQDCAYLRQFVNTQGSQAAVTLHFNSEGNMYLSTPPTPPLSK